jgi:hypothetical protein
LGGDRRAQAAWKRSRESYKDTLDLFLTLVYLKNKKPKKKKKKKTLCTKSNRNHGLWKEARIIGNGGKKAGPKPIPHSEHRSRGKEVLVCSGKPGVAGTQYSFCWQP